MQIDSNTTYEQPLGERIRSFLRLEHLFSAIYQAIAGPTTWDSRHALSGMIEVTDLLSRTDVKAELIKELERHCTTLVSLADKPGVDQQLLEKTIVPMEHQAVQLKSTDYQPGFRVRNDELINQVRQRVSIPGGACGFDLPAYQFWLARNLHERISHLNTWMEDLRRIERGIDTVLVNIRQSAVPRPCLAESGFFQRQLDTTHPCQLIRVVLPANTAWFPEISGGKHRFTVRFLQHARTGARPDQVAQDIDFELQICGI